MTKKMRKQTYQRHRCSGEGTHSSAATLCLEIYINNKLTCSPTNVNSTRKGHRDVY